MAEGDAAVSGGGKGLDFLKQKVGPLPLWVWLAAGIAIIYYIREKQSGGGLSSLFGGGSSSSASAVPNEQTDPAGNIGTIDPATGYVYGTPEDLAALAANNDTGTGTGTNPTSPGGTTYADNNAWGEAAVNYLVGLGINPTEATQAIQLYLNSQTLTTQQQADVNEAIQALGAPPTLPGPTSPGPGGGGGGGSGGGTSATNPPTGVTVSNKQPTSLTVKWNKAANATGYTIQAGQKKGSHTFGTSTGPNSLSTTIGGLTPGTLYYIQVQAKPAKAGAAWGETQASTTKGSTKGKGTTVQPGGPNIPAKK
jgi:hypothetical protein